MSEGKIDPYDVGALEKSLNDSATRVSTIWISFLLFSLYLLTAGATVTHRQLLLAEPVKLPVLNIDLPLWGFFFLAPIQFVVFHVYVLLQVLLLGRTAAAYDQALDRATKSPSSKSILRQRLANTLFAQIFAGSPREREGWLGVMLKAMAWITLAVAPLLILLTFQFAFLAYQSHIATWTHRLLILAELANVFILWPLVLDSRQDFEWPRIALVSKQLRTVLASFASFLAKPFLSRTTIWHPPRARPRQRGAFGILRLASYSLAGLLFVAISLFLATFPGEPHLNLFTGNWQFSVQCERWLFRRFERADLRIDRLVLPGVDVVDDEKLAKIERATEEKERRPYEGERTRSFRDRSLQCGEFDSADFRRADFSGANLTGAGLEGAELQGATLDNTELVSAQLGSAKLMEASLQRANLQLANLSGANLAKANSTNAEFQAADLTYANLQGINASYSKFYGADLSSASLQGAGLVDAGLQGANLNRANLQAATLARAQLQGATLTAAELGGADLTNAQLQGAVLDDKTKLESANMTHTFLWRATKAPCADAQIDVPQFGATIVRVPNSTSDETMSTIEATPDAIDTFILEIIGRLPVAERSRLHELLANRLKGAPPSETAAENEAAWRTCAANATPKDKYYDKLAVYLVRLACVRSWNDYFGIEVILEQSLEAEMGGAPRSYINTLVRGVLGLDRTHCQTSITLSDKLKASLERSLKRPEAD